MIEVFDDLEVDVGGISTLCDITRGCLGELSPHFL